MKVTNTQKGPRGVNAVNGPVLIEPGETVEVEIFDREKAHIEASNWFEIDGKYTENPVVVVAGAPVLKEAADNTGSELERLQALLADRDAELAKLKAQQEEPPKTAAEVIEMAKDPNVQFMSFKAAAAKLLGDKTPAKKDEILLALEELATKPGA
ncbi:hypothetical protein [Sinorhizobium sp. GL28]|uniref:hypothetical protein n=1 Tax=Sinorhizobium sp. GL28 TaxID=1358418 RepID=UPI00071D5163|nr:hypothetical protein [Sinorhizobium sp. GL28]KSV95385.1 hypothetical protein N184_00115 [Sinorhizobium sp. GL28]